MAKMVGLSRNLKLPWLNEVVRLYAEGLEEEQIKKRLNEYLSYEIGSPTVLRKTREILMNIWVYENDYTDSLRDEALRLLQKDSRLRSSGSLVYDACSVPSLSGSVPVDRKNRRV